MEELKVTSGKHWRKLRQEGQLVELPSGNVARLRPVSLIELWRLGKIPDVLTGVVVELLTASRLDPERALEKAAENVKNIADLYVIVCAAAFLEPRIVENPQADNEIAFEDISQEDRERVLAWTNAPQSELRPFRDESQANVEPVRHGEGLWAKTGEATGGT